MYKSFSQALGGMQSTGCSENPVSVISHILIIVGALNWLAVGALNKNLVTITLGNLDKYIFILVGIAGIISAYRFGKWALDDQK